MAQLQSKTLPDSRARDIRRRVDVIQKKLADLQELGIPCAFCYSSVRNTGSLFTLGDTRITDVIERHKNEILLNLNDASFEQSDTSATKEIHLILPPLSAPLDQLSRNQMQSLIVGIRKDLGLKWSDPRPSWWPLESPFVPPRCVPDNFTGKGKHYKVFSIDGGPCMPEPVLEFHFTLSCPILMYKFVTIRGFCDPHYEGVGSTS